MSSNIIETAVSDVLHEFLAEETGDVIAIGFDGQSIERLIEVLTELNAPPTIRVLAQDSALKWVREDFLVASTAAELIANGTLSLRVTSERPENVLLIAQEAVTAVVMANERTAGLVTDDSVFVDSARSGWNDRWEAAEEFPLRTPARSHIEETLTETFGPDAGADFRAMIGSLETVRGEDGIDEIVISILLAAKHEELLYDISKWGEDNGVASKATFSRTKTRLENGGLIDTEKVPIDVGRPRLRLMLGDERLKDATAEELVSVSSGLLSTTAA